MYTYTIIHIFGSSWCFGPLFWAISKLLFLDWVTGLSWNNHGWLADWSTLHQSMMAVSTLQQIIGVVIKVVKCFMLRSTVKTWDVPKPVWWSLTTPNKIDFCPPPQKHMGSKATHHGMDPPSILAIVERTATGWWCQPINQRWQVHTHTFQNNSKYIHYIYISFQNNSKNICIYTYIHYTYMIGLEVGVDRRSLAVEYRSSTHVDLATNSSWIVELPCRLWWPLVRILIVIVFIVLPGLVN